LGDPIIGIDTTENGKYILATCNQYLMVIDTNPSFESPKAFKNSCKSKPRRLQLLPEHVAWMGTNVCFTPAKFNTGPGLEKTIVASSGPFVITWNFRRIKMGKTHDYSIKRYTEDVVADNFKFGADRNIIVALGGNIEMISQKQLQTPTRLLKSRNSIVNMRY
jgi:hypothetical protein